MTMQRRAFLIGVACALASPPARALAPNYPRALANVLVSEGGYTNHPRDPGGVTLNGVIQVRYDEYRDDKGLPRRPLTRAMEHSREWQAARAEIYRRYYADMIAFDALPRGVDYSVFDYAVNSGYGRAGKVLRRVLGMADDTWRVTPDVLAEVRRRDPKALIGAINDERLAFLKRLRTWDAFGGGWGRRVASVRVISLSMASGARQGSGGAFRPAFGPHKAFDDEEVLP